MVSQNSNSVFLTGGTGFVGSAVVEELLRRDYGIAALVHRGELKAGAGSVRVVRGDLFNPSVLDEGLRGAGAAIHLVGIIQEHPSDGITFDRIHFQATRQVVDAAKRAGVKRYIHMSAIGARADAPSAYHRTKFAAEQYVRDSGLDWTILRPSLIHGPAGEFLKMEAAWARGKSPPFLFMPYFGGGLLGTSRPTLVQPVYVNDVARAFVDALEKPQTIGQTYTLGGSQRLTWPQMHHIASEIFTGKRKRAIGIPAWYAKLLTHVVPAKLLPFTRDQVIMAREDSVADTEKFTADFGWEPGGFEQTLKTYAERV